MKLSFDRVSQMIARSLAISVDELFASFTVASIKDLDDVVAFRRAYFRDYDGWDDHAYLQWRFDFCDNPDDAINALWMLSVNGEILGIIGVESFNLMVDGETSRACHPSELLTRPNLNGLGIGAWLSMAVAKKCAILMVVGSTDESLNLIKRLFQPMSNYQSWKLVISSRGTLSRLLHNRFLAGLVALFLDRLIHLRRFISLCHYPVAPYTVRPLTRFTHDMDCWADHFLRARVYRRRDSRYLNWRFIDNPRQQYFVLGLYREKVLVAYSIYFMNYSQNNRQQEAVIADIFWDEQAVRDETPDVLIKSILAATVRELVAKSAKLIELKIIAPGLSLLLSQLGFRCRGEGDIFALMTREPDVDSELYKSENWLLTAADAHDDGL